MYPATLREAEKLSDKNWRDSTYLRKIGDIFTAKSTGSSPIFPQASPFGDWREINAAMRAGGEIGKHAGLRCLCRKAWRFESSPAHRNLYR